MKISQFWYISCVSKECTGLQNLIGSLSFITFFLFLLLNFKRLQVLKESIFYWYLQITYYMCIFLYTHNILYIFIFYICACVHLYILCSTSIYIPSSLFTYFFSFPFNLHLLIHQKQGAFICYLVKSQISCNIMFNSINFSLS